MHNKAIFGVRSLTTTFTRASLLALFVLVFVAPIAHACAYNVRDVGFVVLNPTPYTLEIALPSDIPENTRTNLEDSAFLKLMDTNVQLQIMDGGASPAAAILKYSDRESLTLTPPANLTDTIEVDAFFDSVAMSSLREEIINAVAKHYAVLLVVDGADVSFNEAAQRDVESAITQVTARMDMLPKAIAYPPVVLHMNAQQRTAESVLLWSLGILASDTRTHAIVLYGRARIMGEVLHGDEITDKRLVEYMGIVGADCECGLDRSWMQGAMIPARWDAPMIAKIAATAGFDPENPRTKMEISMTLSKSGTKAGANATPTQKAEDAVKNIYAYNETTVMPEEDVPENEEEKKSALGDPPLVDGGMNTDILIGGFIFAGVVIASILIVLRGRFGKD